MKLLKYLGVAVESVRAHPMRAVLTMLGIIIGIAAVLLTVGIGSGAAASITAQIESQGTNLLTISGTSRGESGSSLTMADAEVLANPAAFPGVALTAPSYSANASVANGGSEGSYQVTGTTTDYATIHSLELAAGRFVSAEDVAANATVIVLGDTVATDLFGGLSPLGQSVRVDDTLFTVIGVLAASGSSGFGSVDTQTYVPIQVAQGRLFNATRDRGSYTVSSISIQVRDEGQIDGVETEVEQVLRLRHGLGADDDNNFTISNQADLLEMADNVTANLSLLLGGISAVSLVVGGIGIMNIMLVTVTERTKEIGLRKALGARDGDILLQFLIEALVLCALGGLIGIAIAYGLGEASALLPLNGFRVIIEPWSVLMALAVSTGSGFVFGLYPALRATKLDPIEALRYE
ncbi:MAG: ABC transporter permease [Caldilineaceae bacterium]